MQGKVNTLFQRIEFPLTVALFFMSLMLASHHNAFALRCGSNLVERGDRKLEVLRLCGEPSFIETWTDETVILRIDDRDEGDINIGRISTANVEEWTYNFGTNRFIKFLKFVNGKVRRIEDGPKGFEGDMPADVNRSRCDSLVSRGDRKIEVLMKCGEPNVIEYFGEDRVSTILRGLRLEGAFQRHDVWINVEEWTYNLGPRRFLLFIRFENGRVSKKERGDYGY